MGCNNCKKNNKTMRVDTVNNLTNDEIEFCKIWEKVIKDKAHVDGAIVDKCYKLVFKKGLDSWCPQCLSDSARYLQNYWNLIADKYNEWKQQIPVTTQYEAEIEKPIEPVKPIKRDTAKKKSPVETEDNLDGLFD